MQWMDGEMAEGHASAADARQMRRSQVRQVRRTWRQQQQRQRRAHAEGADTRHLRSRRKGGSRLDAWMRAETRRFTG
jgi:hypothetical protein